MGGHTRNPTTGPQSNCMVYITWRAELPGMPSKGLCMSCQGCRLGPEAALQISAKGSLFNPLDVWMPISRASKCAAEGKIHRQFGDFPLRLNRGRDRSDLAVARDLGLNRLGPSLPFNVGAVCRMAKVSMAMRVA